MSFFSSIGDWFSSGDAAGPLIGAAGAVAGAAITSSANKSAAKTAAEAAQSGAAAIKAGNDAAQLRYDQMRDDAAPGVSALRAATLNPGQLTAFQKQQLTEARDSANRSLRASGLSGSGRAQVATLRSVEGDLRNRFMNDNENRASQAASQLAGQAQTAGIYGARTEADTGRAVGEAAYGSGVTDAQARIANATLTGAAIGDIAGIVKDDLKAHGRRSKYPGEHDKE